MKDTKLVFDSLKKDLSGGIIIGILASIFAMIIANNVGSKISNILIFLVLFSMCVIGIFVGRFLGKFKEFFYKFVKFGEVGGLNWLTDLGVLNILILLTGFSTGIYYSLFKGVSFLFSAVNSYFWNKLWVFDKNKTKNVGKEVGKFSISTLTGMFFNIGVATLVLLISKNLLTGVGDTGLANIAAIAGSLSAMLLNFVLYRFWVFK